MDIAALHSDYGSKEMDTRIVKLEENLVGISSQQNQYHTDVMLCNSSKATGRRHDSGENRSSSALSTGQSGTSVLDREQSPVDDSSPYSPSPVCSAPLCRQFWKAGVYNDELTPKSTTQTAGSNYLHIHPKFLHSNATSHKWAFGAVAELLDNAVDEIQNGATYVLIDKAVNPRDGTTALLIQDDGGGMDPEAMRSCLSFGFSDKKSESAIGKYGNGFKTSTMRLGADVVVFSRNFRDTTLTQSIGLLSYTFLTQEGYDRIVVPMLHYEFNFVTGSFNSLQLQSKDNSNLNLSVLLQWSPYSTEEELLKQFDDVGAHGTKIIIYNLWFDDEGIMELDFESDPEDIRIAWDGKTKVKDDSLKAISEQHIAKRLRYSLRAYLSILYLKVPETFCMVLRGKVVLYHNIATDLKHPEFILYKPHSGGSVEGTVVTTIGFLKEAPDVNIHGFNVYHKNRLILPFLPMVTSSNCRSRGVVGVLEANFIEPTHSKQDFEKTIVFQKLVTRLKDMTLEYWDFHCHLIGYQMTKKARPSLASPGSANVANQHATELAVPSRNSSSAVTATQGTPVVTSINNKAALYTNSSLAKPAEIVSSIPRGFQGGAKLKRKVQDQPEGFQLEEQMNVASNLPDFASDQQRIKMVEQNKKLRSQCLEFAKAEEELNLKVMLLKKELDVAEAEYGRLLDELQCLEKVKGEPNAAGHVS